MSRAELHLSCNIFDIWWDSTGLAGFLGVWPSEVCSGDECVWVGGPDDVAGGLGGDNSGTGLGEGPCLEGEELPPDIIPERS